MQLRGKDNCQPLGEGTIGRQAINQFMNQELFVYLLLTISWRAMESTHLHTTARTLKEYVVNAEDKVCAQRAINCQTLTHLALMIIAVGRKRRETVPVDRQHEERPGGGRKRAPIAMSHLKTFAVFRPKGEDPFPRRAGESTCRLSVVPHESASLLKPPKSSGGQHGLTVEGLHGVQKTSVLDFSVQERL